MPIKDLSVYDIDFKYRKYLRKICVTVLQFYRGIPLTWEDIYNNFLFEAKDAIKEYDKKTGVSVETYLGMKCKFFAFNYCKSFETNKHKIMNKSLPIDSAKNSALHDSITLPHSLDTSLLTPLELEVYTAHFLNGETRMEISEKKGITEYKVKKIIKNIRVKMIMMLKN